MPLLSKGGAMEQRGDFAEKQGQAGCAAAASGPRASTCGMRYVCTGEVHRDFHASTLDCVNYLIDNYGEDAARKVLDKTGKEVYRQMHRKLVAGDASELLEWWRYYLGREGGDFDIDEHADGTATLTVHDCPALRHLASRGIPGGRRTCWATRVLNESLCEGSPFEIALEETGDFSCRQILRLKPTND